MGFYLLDHPPARRQFVTRRRAAETGCIVVHTPEGGIDLHPPDTKAEDVARFIRTRTTAGSYHRICDSDSTVAMMPWTYEAAQDGTGSNPWAVGISVACNAADWPHLLAYEPAWVDGALVQLALAAADYALDLHRRTGIVIPARWISKAQSAAAEPGFITHGARDPGRRTDPGPAFPRRRFLDLYAYFCQLNGLDVTGASPPTPAPSEEDDDMRQIVRAPDGAVYLFDGATLRPANDETYREVLKLSGADTPTPEIVAVWGGRAGEWFQWGDEQIEATPLAPNALDLSSIKAGASLVDIKAALSAALAPIAASIDDIDTIDGDSSDVWRIIRDLADANLGAG